MSNGASAWQFLLVAGVPALASVIGGLIALKLKTSSLLLSLAVGLAGGVLLGTFAFEMLPEALEIVGVAGTVLAFIGGFACVYLFDLWVNRWRTAGDKADQKRRVDRFHGRKPPRGSSISVLAGGTSGEELIEGLSIGVGLAINPATGLMVALAVTIDNLAEALSIGELARADGAQEQDKRGVGKQVLGWTGLIGAALFVSAAAGFFLLRALPEPVLAALLAAGAGGMFYLTVTQLAPEAQSHQYQQSSAIAIAAGFLIAMALANLGG
ncbi:ZIP family metal transporter [Brevundimonas sp. PAMC22021]|uniref:ZIP family metal transporter n=1 Tax=Brevundimonas sp. PAMC22021 TaxID=2861285 RepID=UPI001C626F38|nr:hypothetical protein [Brevundimonas sp. PAMC22021]QYF87091.1 hypothetical protein KY493_00770 [Brevundimonas sp. PAMC22021]